MDFELTTLQRSKQSADIARGNQLVEKFISERKLIIYGGTAIDYALRLKGQHIYDDALLPYSDYDFFSPTNVQDAYDFTMQLKHANFASPSATGALYIRTMRVGFEGNIIADISFIPEIIFNKIKFMTIKIPSGLELRIVAPWYQVIDMHLSLSLPYINPPTEAVMHRGEKDIKRFNILYEAYVKEYVAAQVAAAKLVEVTIEIPTIIYDNITTGRGLCAGLICFAFIQDYAISKLDYKFKFCRATWPDCGTKLKLQFVADAKVPLCCYVQKEDLELTNRAFLDFFPESRQTVFDKVVASVFLSHNKQFPAVEAGSFKLCTMQLLLFYFAVRANLFSNEELEPVYWAYYAETLEMLNFIETAPEKSDFKFNAIAEFGTGVWPSVDEVNISESINFWMNVTEASINDKINKTQTVGELFSKKPKAFYPDFPGSSDLLKTIYQYDYDSEYFTVDGGSI